MAQTTIPGLGHFSKKELYIGGGLAGIVVIVALYRQHKNSQAAAAATSADTSSNIDPNTGLTAGSPEDIAALEAQSSYANATDYGYASGGDYGSNTGSALTGVTSNAEWAQAAESYLTQYAAADAATVSAALGAYITGSYVTADQQTIIEQAIAFEGYPPQSGSNGYPPAMKTTPTTLGGGNPPKGGGPTPVGTAGKTLPAVGTVIYPPAEVKAGNTAADIAKHFGISLAHLMTANPGVSNSPPIGTVLRVPYQIKTGMTLESVASAFGISVPHLQEYLP